MLVAIGGLYATTGTLNLADMTRRLADPAAYGVEPAPVLGLSALLFAVFALKAGIVPFQFWVPAAYRAAPAPVAAVLAGVVKKVGIYAIVRLYFTVFAAASLPVSLPGVGGDSVLAFYGPVLSVLAAASIVLGGVMAIDRPDLDGLLSYSSIGQVGFVVLPLGVAATAVGPTTGAVDSVAALGVAAALVYSLNHALAKATLFLASGTIADATDTVVFDDLGGLLERAPVLSGSVFVAGVALVGVPPVVGFFGKLLVFDVAVRAGAWPALAVALGGAVLTIAYFTRAWGRGFWGEPGEVPVATAPALVAVVAVMALALVGVGVAFEPVADAATTAGETALDREGYVEAVAPQRYDGPGLGAKEVDGSTEGALARAIERFDPETGRLDAGTRDLAPTAGAADAPPTPDAGVTEVGP
jgi:multicomponent Na+:H+ antiporter subunit D